MCAYLGLTETDLNTPAPYVRVLALNDRGREILRLARQKGEFINAGEVIDHPYQALENRCSDLYGLFQKHSPGAPGTENTRRIFYHKP